MSSLLTLILFLVALGIAAGVGASLVFIRRQLKKRTDGLYYESQQGPIFYRIHGHKGPVVLLIHGLGASTYCWRHLIPELCHKYKVISFDLWGFGYSSKTMKKKMDLDTQIEVINELLDHLKVNKFHIVGHSMGAEIGLWMKHTDKRVQKCIAITPAAHPNLVSDWFQVFHWVANLTPLLITPNSIRRLLTRSLEDSAFITDDMVQAYYEPYTDPMAHLSFAAALNIIKDPRVFNNLEKIRENVSVIWGAHDAVISRSLVRLMTDKFGAERTVTHPWSGHLPMEDDKVWLGETVRSLLES